MTDGEPPNTDGGRPEEDPQESTINTPEYDRAFQTFFFDAEGFIVRSSSHLLSSLPESRKFERLPRMISGGGRPGTGQEHSATEIVFDGVIKRSDIENTSIEAFEGAILEIATSVAEQTTRSIFKTLGEVTEATGQTIKATGASLLDDIILGLERCEWEWDNDLQQLTPPTLYLGAEMSKKFKAAVEADGHFESRLAELGERKQREYLANRRSRRIRHQPRGEGT